jgi:hypothetical protein
MNNKRGTDGTESKSRERVAVEESCATDYDDDDADDFHASSVDDGSLDDPAADEFALPRTSSPEKFFIKLKRKLSNLGVRYERLTKKMPEGQAPPCFKLAGASEGQTDYEMWLTMASLTSDVPHRYDVPGEPNYCRDCTAHFRHKAMQSGACIFPNVIFETASNNGEKEVVGVSRSPRVIPDGYRVFREMVVDEIAIEDEGD